ncbi:MAG: Ig-like domain-containing protein [Thermoplasmata archaeon]|nr:MAG: Ig-like domain-containing protein [Thermoplasmata archaeon]
MVSSIYEGEGSTRSRADAGRRFLWLSLAFLAVLTVVVISGSTSGETWDDHLNITEDMRMTIEDVATDGDQVFVLGKGRYTWPYGLVLKWYDGEEWHPWVMVGDEASWTWFATASIDAEDGVAHLVWVDMRAGWAFYDLYYTTFENGTFGNHTKLDVGNDRHMFWPYVPEIVVQDGQVHVIWRELPFTEDDRLKYRRFNGTEWEDTVILYGDARSTIMDPCLAVEGGTVHIVWKDSPYMQDGYSLLYRTWDGEQLSRVEIVAVDITSQFQASPDIVVRDGTVHIVWSENTTGPSDIKYRVKDGGRWGRTIDLTPGDINEQSHISIDSEGPYMFLTWRHWDGDRGVIRFRWVNGTDWQDDVNLTDDIEYNHERAVLAVGGGQVHVAWYLTSPWGWTPFYTRGFFDEEPPFASLEPLEGTWLDPEGVDLSWTASDDYMLDRVVLRYSYSPDGAEWTAWTPFENITVLEVTRARGGTTFVPSSGDGFYRFQAVAIDVRGTWERDHELAEAQGILDTTPPTGTIIINQGDEFTTSIDVVLDLTRSDNITDLLVTVPEEWLYRMRISNEPVWDGVQWVNATDQVDWTLANIEGTRTVYYQLMDRSGLVSETFSDDIVLDTLAPTGSVTIDDDAAWTTSTDVVLNIAYLDAISGVTHMRLSDDGVWDDEEWLHPNQTVDWSLVGGDGENTVHLQLMDAAGLVSPTYTDTIVLDTTPPGCSITIDNDASYTGSTSVQLSISYWDDATTVEGIRVSGDGSFDGLEWLGPIEIMRWTLPEGSGTKTVHLQARDAVGHISDVVSDDIVLDEDDPTCSFTINGGAGGTNSRMFHLSITYEDPTSYVSDMQIWVEGFWEDTPWVVADEEVDFLVMSDEGETTINLMVRDAVGRESEMASATIVLDVTRPSVVSTFPTNGSINVDVEAELVIQWSEPMDPEHLGSIRLYLDDELVLGLPYIDAANGTARFDPDNPLKMGREYRFVVSEECQDVWGNQAITHQEVTFTTEEADTSGPDGLAILPWIILIVIIASAVAIVWVWERRNRDEAP